MMNKFHSQFDGLEPKLMNSLKLMKLVSLAMLLNTGLALSQAIELDTKTETVALLKYAASGDLKSVQKILDSGANINAEDPIFHATALHNASSQGHQHVVDWLLENRADIESQDSTGSTPLIWAAYTGKTRIIQSLLKAGAKPNHVPKHGPTALVAAIQSGQIKAVKTLLEHGAKTSLEDSNAMTPVQAAQLKNNQPILKLINKAGDES